MSTRCKVGDLAIIYRMCPEMRTKHRDCIGRIVKVEYDAGYIGAFGPYWRITFVREKPLSVRLCRYFNALDAILMPIRPELVAEPVGTFASLGKEREGAS